MTITEAVALCRKYPPGTGINCQAEFELFAAARELVVAKYLVDHPADDEEPTEKDWLAMAGFTVQFFPSTGYCADIAIEERTGWWCFLRIVVPSMECQLMQATPESTQSEGVVLPKSSAQTRGDVRRLCRALGVNLEETP